MSKELEKAEEPEITERLERLIWRSAGRKSVRKLAEETGLDAAYLLRVRNTLLDEVDSLTVYQLKTKLLVELQEIAEEAREAAEGVSDERNKAGLYNSAISAMDKVLKALNRVTPQEQAELDRLNLVRARELVRLVERVVFSTLSEVADKYELDESNLRGIAQENLVIIAEEMDSE